MVSLHHHFSGQPGYGYQPVFSPASPLVVQEGASQSIQPPTGSYCSQWTRADGQPLPSGISAAGSALQISGARPDQAGTYYCELAGPDGSRTSVPYEIRVHPSARPQPAHGKFK